MAQHFRARLLDPLQYHSFIDAGASGGTVTAPFLGDLALCYAINNAVLGQPLPETRWVHGKRATGPDYKGDLERLGLLATMGVPDAPAKNLNPEFQGSSYMNEGFEQREISSGAAYYAAKKHRRYSRTTSSSWRPWRQAQLLAPGNMFRFSLLRGPSLPERFALRMGTGRAGLIAVEACDAPATVTVNAWTLEAVVGIDAAGLSCTRREYPLAQYTLVHGVPLAEIENKLEGRKEAV